MADRRAEDGVLTAARSPRVAPGEVYNIDHLRQAQIPVTARIEPRPSRNTHSLEHLLEPRVRLQRVKLFADREPDTHILATPLV